MEEERAYEILDELFKAYYNEKLISDRSVVRANYLFFKHKKFKGDAHGSIFWACVFFGFAVYSLLQSILGFVLIMSLISLIFVARAIFFFNEAKTFMKSFESLVGDLMNTVKIRRTTYGGEKA